MPSRIFGALAIASLIAVTPCKTPAQGLYNDGKTTTTGDLMDQDYWFAKFDRDMLELAIQQHQPEGRIDYNLAMSINRLNDLIKKYPKHDELPKWRARAMDVQKKINPNATRSTPFNAGLPWEEANYAQLWVNWHFGRMLLDAKDYVQARLMLSNVMQNYDIMLRPDRMKDYPEDLRKWVIDSKPEADKMWALAKSKTGGMF